MTRGTGRLIVAGALLLLAARSCPRREGRAPVGRERRRRRRALPPLARAGRSVEAGGPGPRRGSLAVTLLGLRDDLRLREAAQLYRRSCPRSELRTPRMAGVRDVGPGRARPGAAVGRPAACAVDGRGTSWACWRSSRCRPTRPRRATTPVGRRRSSRRRSSSIRRTGPRGTTSSSSSPCASRGAARSRSRTATTWAHGRGTAQSGSGF